MNRRDKIGLAVLVAILSFFVVALIWTLRGSWKPTHEFSDSVIVKQRMKYLNK